MRDEPLPGMPEPPPRSPRVVRGGKAQAVRTRPTRLCDRCCELIHLRGQQGAAYPRAGRWRVTTGQFVRRLCDTHKDEVLHGEQGVWW